MPYIKNEIIDKIYECDLCEAIGRIYHEPSYKILSNGTAKGLSPFTNERTPSFVVSNVKGIWKDFASGRGGKSVIEFIQAYKGMDFPEAVKLACEVLNIPIEYEKETEAQKAKRQEKKSLGEIIAFVKENYKKNLPKLSLAQQYMQERGFSQEILSDFEIGYALAGMYEVLKERGQVSEGVALGVLKAYQNGGYYDFFKGRIIFPISDKHGHCVGFGGRVMPSEAKEGAPKYLNSPESEVFHKSELLYGFHLARNSMAQRGEVYLVEGYTDVMRMHQIGLRNCVATLGTALSAQHLDQIKKLCKKLIIFRDSDNAGATAAYRDMGLALEAGLFVERVVFASEGKEDPDSIGQREGAVALIEAARCDAVLHYLQGAYEEALGRADTKGKKVILMPEDKKRLSDLAMELIGKIPDVVTRDAYMEQVKARFGIKVAIEKPKEEKTYLETPRFSISDFLDEIDLLERYQFPKEVEDPSVYKNEILEYGVFQHANRIYCSTDKGNAFYDISNFSIEIIQHMQDEQFPMKLIRICNVHGVEKIFDVLSEKINTLNSFKNVVTSYGNFSFSGSAAQHERLLRYLFDRMGTGRKIDVLGWQAEGFWVWNNKIVIPGLREEAINSEGLFKYQHDSYYIPSANKNFEKNMYKYGAQKKFRSIPTEVSLPQYLKQLYKVHRGHAITGILFGIGSLFQDIVVSCTGFFPILFYFGPASTGKDNICEAIQSFVGQPQTAIQLEGSASTIKAQIREFAQFSNGISQLSEYKRGNPQVDGIIKGLWDRRGYKRGSIESRVAVDEVPIISSTLLTGNDSPDAEALITRLIWEEMKVQEFSEEAKASYNKLKDMCRRGVSGISDWLLHKRAVFQEHFLEVYREKKRLLSEREAIKGVPVRMIDNLAVLYAVYGIFEREGIFPFWQEDMERHFDALIENQRRKIESDSVYQRFWDCFMVCMRLTQGERLQVDTNLRAEGGSIYFNFSTVYSIVQRQWFVQYREQAPGKSEMRRQLREDSSYMGEEKSIRINTNINSPTSAMKIDIGKLRIREELLAEIEVQSLRTASPFAPAAPTESEETIF
ncbi:DNA primase [Capnocytophaga gingivalis]|uniref:DNA primase n=1 Tax=Capnocytophaga gingivalis TaxID=1017 RepID=A0A250FRX1_9FLAO|nr:DNA primase [Capnocytophaga gingivalis]ATA87870.1 DNA primase [Capnocytophaga gingivalis]